MPNTGPIDGSRRHATLVCAEAVQRVGEPDGGGGLALAGGRRGIAVTRTSRPGVGRQGGEVAEVDLGLVVAVGHQVLVVDPEHVSATSVTGATSAALAISMSDGKWGGCVDVDAHTPPIATTASAGDRRLRYAAPVEGERRGWRDAHPALVPTLDGSSMPRSAGSAAPNDRVRSRPPRGPPRHGAPHPPVQAGTGTGKSPASARGATRHGLGTPTVVATATLALQAQIVDRDMPRLAELDRPAAGSCPTYALVKGRRNYLCAHKPRGRDPGRRRRHPDVGRRGVHQQASRLGAEGTAARLGRGHRTR